MCTQWVKLRLELRCHVQSTTLVRLHPDLQARLSGLLIVHASGVEDLCKLYVWSTHGQRRWKWTSGRRTPRPTSDHVTVVNSVRSNVRTNVELELASVAYLNLRLESVLVTVDRYTFFCHGRKCQVISNYPGRE